MAALAGPIAGPIASRSDSRQLPCASSAFFGSQVPSQVRLSAPSQTQRGLKVEAAISRSKKESNVELAKKELENCYLLASINYKTFTVKQFSELRAKLPESVSLLVMKNSLMEKAIEGTEFEALKPSMTGMNAFLFVHSEEIPPALKPFRELQKEQKLEDNDYTGAVFEGKFYGPKDFKTLETLPSREEIYAKLLGVLQSPASQVVSTLQAPARDLVFTLKAYVNKLEEEQGSSS